MKIKIYFVKVVEVIKIIKTPNQKDTNMSKTVVYDPSCRCPNEETKNRP